MAIKQAPQLKLEKLTTSEPIAIVQQQSEKTPAQKARAKMFEIRVAQSPSEVIKIGELNTDASKLVQEKLKKEGKNPDGTPLGSETKTNKAESKKSKLGITNIDTVTKTFTFESQEKLQKLVTLLELKKLKAGIGFKVSELKISVNPNAFEKLMKFIGEDTSKNPETATVAPKVESSTIDMEKLKKNVKFRKVGNSVNFILNPNLPVNEQQGMIEAFTKHAENKNGGKKSTLTNQVGKNGQKQFTLTF